MIQYIALPLEIYLSSKDLQRFRSNCLLTLKMFSGYAFVLIPLFFVQLKIYNVFFILL